MAMARIFGSCESPRVADTVVFDNYSQYKSPLFDPAAKKKRNEGQCPEDCKRRTSPGAGWYNTGGESLPSPGI